MTENQPILTSNDDAVYSRTAPQYVAEIRPNAPPYQIQQPYQGSPGFTSPPVYVVQAATVYGEFPVAAHCHACNTDVMTVTTFNAGTLTWLSSGIICLVGGWVLCCLIPFCINACKDVVHFCPNCHAVIGKYNRLG
ncbi:LITAF domain-containing protein-like [Saccoglossus kowalevskii]|uniref:Lipopolysaccharide-induced tumor necrosis factor-alpha factor homolog n=1 Tax=Saccoglossus kowalevskii TaxID=10224 RepID=A0ABM0MQK8_SACKO|nr:PREDICTED: lipopolysaccharide-induced tumor necrosis factor-alpha factor homolog [Saccoglossus kowalevskii]